ncbi:MAG: hypothetical protein PWR01_2162 [Clostridiales bacterium]|jgi:hypothetical protein|nr:hypothetical protein [Clostridiales bacterium]MDN5281089.1 hypothetical protein [Candidatus Ozemobacter sp.]
MKITESFSVVNKRRGGLKVIVALIVLVGALLIGIFLNGSLAQEKQQNLLAKGYEQYNDGDLDAALKSFSDAAETFSFTLSFYRTLKSSDQYVTQNELGELAISICLAAAHDSFFALNPAPDWVEKAKEQLPIIVEPERKKELEQLVNTAGEISKLCVDFAAGQVEKALKDLKKVEENALGTDQDFFIFEIRFLIACGKALNEPAILAQARELLFFATTDAGINNSRTQRLWGILTN